jgi:hypothetical protein
VDSLELSLDIRRMRFDDSFLAWMEPAVQTAFKDEIDALDGHAQR